VEVVVVVPAEGDLLLQGRRLRRLVVSATDGVECLMLHHPLGSCECSGCLPCGRRLLDWGCWCCEEYPFGKKGTWVPQHKKEPLPTEGRCRGWVFFFSSCASFSWSASGDRLLRRQHHVDRGFSDSQRGREGIQSTSTSERVNVKLLKCSHMAEADQSGHRGSNSTPETCS
jgi:hypothetical protein